MSTLKVFYEKFTIFCKSFRPVGVFNGSNRRIIQVSHTLRLAQLSPEIIHLALIGALPEHITLKSLKTGLPADWEEQVFTDRVIPHQAKQRIRNDPGALFCFMGLIENFG